MKNITLLIVLLFSVTFVNAQNEKSNSDTTKIKLGDKTIIIVDKNDESEDTVSIKEEIKDEKISIKQKENKIKTKKRYNSKKYSRWAGLYLGVNQFGDIRDGGELTANFKNWEINPWKSKIWNINFMEINLSIIKKHILLTTGFGLEYKNFSFKNDIDLVEENGKVDPVVNNSLKYKKDKLHVSYFQMPLLLEFNTSSRPGKGFYLAAGFVGGLKMYSKLYQKYDLGDNTIKKRTKSDFNLNPYQLYGTLRIGIKRLTLYGNFDLMPLFKESESTLGDNLMVVSAGVKLIGF